jgi:hypothetical protein
MRTTTRRSGDVLSYLVAVLVLAVGAAGIVAGEADDSPGLQLLGALLVIGAIVAGVRTARRGR